MTAPVFPPFHVGPALAARKKRVLLVDSARATRDLRSETMRRLGAEVDCAADISEARCWWRADLYDLVLINVAASKVQMDKFCDDIRRFMPQQQIMFLVGKPDYLALLPNEPQTAYEDGEQEQFVPVAQDNSSSLSKGLSERWGILEACRRIAAVRSKMDARTRAMRDLPGPKRDCETRSRHKTELDVLAVPALMEKAQ
jgi:CheY-like chemotaxis protein